MEGIFTPSWEKAQNMYQWGIKDVYEGAKSVVSAPVKVIKAVNDVVSAPARLITDPNNGLIRGDVGKAINTVAGAPSYALAGIDNIINSNWQLGEQKNENVDAPTGDSDSIKRMEEIYKKFDPASWAREQMVGARRETGLKSRKGQSDVRDYMQSMGSNAAYSGRSKSAQEGLAGSMAAALAKEGANINRKALEAKQAMADDIKAAKAGVALQDLQMKQRLEEIQSGVTAYKNSLTAQGTGYLGQALGNWLGDMKGTSSGGGGGSGPNFMAMNYPGYETNAGTVRS